ncbi:hypothetical protein F5884DRAFT_674827 [Xylogone sp. PMI_703]|nr:hypothetical protein F5884DRAFT_674827 [Xylogone sp. PMI_703]
MSGSSISITTCALSTYIRKMTHVSKAEMEIILENHNDNDFYTNSDALSGRVEIRTDDSQFEVVEITLEGIARTFVESISRVTGIKRRTVSHTFLKLAMPIPVFDNPLLHITEARIHTFPFNFVIPEQLLPSSCSHNVEADHVQYAHLQLPPSMGNREYGNLEDFCPEMANIQYFLRVRVLRCHNQDGKEVVLAEGTRRLNVLPTIPAAPPMNITPHDSYYCLSRSKPLKRGVLSGKFGKITVSAAQPGAFVVPIPTSHTISDTTPITTFTNLTLRFDPYDFAYKPPRLGNLTSKIDVSTFYSIRLTQTLIDFVYVLTDYDPTRGAYNTSIPLSSRCMAAVTWTKHELESYDSSNSQLGRYHSAVTANSDHSVSSDAEQNGDLFYTATIIVPLTLPNSKAWIPTFHSCTISRIYSLDLKLTIYRHGNGVPASSVCLKLPVQISSEKARQ